jgi:hypothetical protein
MYGNPSSGHRTDQRYAKHWATGAGVSRALVFLKETPPGRPFAGQNLFQPDHARTQDVMRGEGVRSAARGRVIWEKAGEKERGRRLSRQLLNTDALKYDAILGGNLASKRSAETVWRVFRESGNDTHAGD